MLCKASNSYLFPEATIDAWTPFATNNNIWTHSYWLIGTITTPWGGKSYKYVCNLKFYNNAYNVSPYSSIWAEIDGGAKEKLLQLERNYNGNYDVTIDFVAKSTAKIYTYNPMDNSSMTTSISAQTNKYSVWIPPKDGINGRPRELEEISDKARTTIFWIHIDGSRVTQE